MGKTHFALWYNPDGHPEDTKDEDILFIPICNPLKYYTGRNYLEMYDYDHIDCKKCEKTFNDKKLFNNALNRYDGAFA